MKILKILFILGLVIFLSACGNTGVGKDDMDYEDVKDLIEEMPDDKAVVRGSCNFIPTKSQCVDFIGSVFSEDRMKLSCAEGTFSKNSCPYSELGGCQATGGTISESIIWSYAYGGQPLSAEEAGYAAKACNAIPVSKWVMPDDLLSK